MLAPGLANLCWRSISCSGCLRTLIIHFGSLLKKLLFLGRTLLLRLCVLGAHVRGSGLGGLESSQSSWGLANLWWYRNGGTRASKHVVAQQFVFGGLRTFINHFESVLKKLLFLGRTLLLRLWVLGTHVRKRLGQRRAARAAGG